MVDYAKYQRAAVDDLGNIIPNINVEVRRESDNGLETLYSARTGTGLANPSLFASGEVEFHIIGGVYKVRLYNGLYDKTFRYVGIGRNSEQDPPTTGQLESFLVAGLPTAASSTARVVFVSNESGGATVAFSDGTNWRRVQDRAIVS